MINFSRFNLVVTNESVVPFMEKDITAISSTIFKTPISFKVTETYEELTKIILPEFLGDFKDILYYARDILEDSLIASDLGYFACRIYLLRFLYAVRYLKYDDVLEYDAFALKGYKYFNDFIKLDYDANFIVNDYLCDFALIKVDENEGIFDIYNKGDFKAYSLNPRGLNLLTRTSSRILGKTFRIKPNSFLFLISDGISYNIKNPIAFEALMVKNLLRSRDIIMYATWLKNHYKKLVDYDASFVINMPGTKDFSSVRRKYKKRQEYLDNLLYDKTTLALIEKYSADDLTKSKFFDEINNVVRDNLYSICTDIAKSYLDGTPEPCLSSDFTDYFSKRKEQLKVDWLKKHESLPVVYKKEDLESLVETIRVKNYSNFISLLLTNRSVDTYTESVLDKYIPREMYLRYLGYLGPIIVDKSRFNDFYLEYYKYERL